MGFLRDPVIFISTLIQKWLTPLDLPASLAGQIVPTLGAVVLPLLAMLWVIFLIWYERKIIGRLTRSVGTQPGWAVRSLPTICRYGQDLHQRIHYPRRSRCCPI